MMNEPADLGKAHLRLVRPSDDLAGNSKFYRDKKGKTFEDPDGYQVVLQHASWPA
jgi:hypothetical protein